jgi:ABC-2 type transport system permease protein
VVELDAPVPDATLPAEVVELEAPAPEATPPPEPAPEAPSEPAPEAPSEPAPEAPPEPAPEAPPEEPAAAAPPPAEPAPASAPAAARSTVYDALWGTGLPNVLTLVRRDLAALFLRPVGYAIASAVVVPVALLGYLVPALSGQPVSMEGVFRWLAVAMTFLVPLVTTRLLADPLDLVLSSPVRFWELVIARWLAGLLFFLAASAFTLLYAALLAVQQPDLDWGPILAGYVGVVLVGSAWVALGLFAASLTRNRAAAVVAGIVALVALQYAAGTAAGFLSPPLSDTLDYASAANRAQSFEGGQLVLRDAVYFLSLTAGGLFLTARVLASRRWR